MLDREAPIQRMGMQMSRGTWLNFRWDFSATILYSFFNVIFNQFYVPIAIQHGASSFQVGLLSAAPAIGLIFSPFWASWIERSRPKPFMIYPNFIGRLLIIVPALYAAPWVFVAVVLAFHVLMGIQAPAYASLVTRMYPPQLRGRLMGNVRVAMGFLMIPMAYLIGKWMDYSGSSGPLITGSVLGVVSILVFCGIKEIEPVAPRAAAVHKSAILSQFRLLKENRRLALFLAATTFSGFGNMLASPLYQIVQVQRLELTNVELGYIRMVYYTFLILAYWLMGKVIDRYSPKHAMYFGIGGFTLVPLLYGALGSYPSLLLAGGLQGFADATWDIGCMAYVFRIAPGREAVVFGLHLMLFGVRGTIGPLLSTALAGTVPLPLIFFAAFGCGILALLLFASEKPSKELETAKA